MTNLLLIPTEKLYSKFPELKGKKFILINYFQNPCYQAILVRVDNEIEEWDIEWFKGIKFNNIKL